MEYCWVFAFCRCKLLTVYKFSNLFDKLTEAKEARCLQGGLKTCDSWPVDDKALLMSLKSYCYEINEELI